MRTVKGLRYNSKYWSTVDTGYESGDPIVFNKQGKKKSIKISKSKKIISDEGTSLGEILIYRFLKENKLEFAQEKVFEDCVNPETRMPLRFDFWIESKNTCIEFNGSQHYKISKEYHSRDKKEAKEQLYKQKFRDQLKVKYCKSKGIKLVVVSYKKIKRINEILTK